jgi:N utilization substance protein A
MLDRLAALGLISVFDVEEVGHEVLMEHLADMGLTEEMAIDAVDRSAARAKEVAAQQEAEREDAERRREEEEAALIASDEGEAQAAAILGGLGDAPATESAEPAGDADEASGDIMDLLGGGTAGESSTDEPDESADDRPHDVAMADEAGQTDQDESSTSDPTDGASADVAKLAEGEADFDSSEDEVRER